MKEAIGRTFSANESYKLMVNNYKKTDGILAIFFFVFHMILLYLTGWVLVQFDVLLNSIFGLVTICLVFLLIRGRKQSVQTVGITRTHILRSSLVGLILSLPFIAFTVIPRITATIHAIQLFNVLYSIFFYLIVISFGEEVVYRGYIQPRLHGLIKNNFLAVILGGTMFSIMHIPFQSALYYFHNGQLWPSWITPLQLLLWFGWHIVFNAIYRKYNSLAGSVILHFFMNFTIIQAVFLV